MPTAGVVMRLIRRTADPALVLRGVYHELRPPLATLAALARALEARADGPRHAELARLAAEYAAHAEAVLAQAAGPGAGPTGPRAAPAVQPLHRVVAAAAATVPAGRLGVSLDPAAGRWPVHSQHTRQILINLLGNAARHSPTGGAIRLHGSVRGRWLRLAVADEGRPTRALRRALRRRRPPRGPHGYGLWLVRRLAAAHGGRVRLRPLAPYGLAVEVELPRAR